MKPALTIKRLKAGGFVEAGRWCVDADGVLEVMDLPTKPGVYAFAIDGVAQYVGIASISLAKRLRFYARPGISQRTSLRLNKQITELCSSGSRIDVLIAFPENFEWGAFVVKGAEGLEAGIIGEYHLPWNIRGAGNGRARPTAQKDKKQTGSSMPRKRGSGFYVYENWVRDKAIVHRSDCSFCNEGNGLHGSRTTKSSTWHGPYETPAAAMTGAKRCRRTRTEGCATCSPL